MHNLIAKPNTWSLVATPEKKKKKLVIYMEDTLTNSSRVNLHVIFDFIYNLNNVN